MTVYDNALKRRSIRTFTNEKIGDEVITKLMESAMAAPSACNMQPWEFYIVKNKELREQLKNVGRYSNMDSSLIIIVAGNDKRSLNHRVNDFWIQDCAAATENILLTATEMGIASCWCGLFPMVTPVKKVRKILGLEEHIIPMALIHLGYSNQEPEPRTQYNKKRIHIFE